MYLKIQLDTALNHIYKLKFKIYRKYILNIYKLFIYKELFIIKFIYVKFTNINFYRNFKINLSEEACQKINKVMLL